MQTRSDIKGLLADIEVQDGPEVAMRIARETTGLRINELHAYAGSISMDHLGRVYIELNERLADMLGN